MSNKVNDAFEEAKLEAEMELKDTAQKLDEQIREIEKRAYAVGFEAGKKQTMSALVKIFDNDGSAELISESFSENQ